MGLFTYTVAGAALILIGGLESLASAAVSLKEIPHPPNIRRPAPATTSFLSTVTFLLISIVSVLFIVNSLMSLSDAASSKDSMGFVLQLEVIAIALLFLLYSGLGILSSIIESFRFPSKLLNVIYMFAFGEEFLLFYTQNKDPSGIENRYYDLILVPISVCLFSTILELKGSKSNYPKLGRGVGLVLQGMWTLQMGFSFYSNLIANGCALHARSRGNYTIKCKGHPEYHRGRAIATLQFNCHLALLITIAAGVYSLFCKTYSINRDFMRYKPLGVGDGGDMQLDNSQFTLESDDEDDETGIQEVRSVEMQKTVLVVPESTVNA
ncbi:uncharacterized protein LOC130987393 isoform X2 [Salvia miltiorrhiza]|uniref:uncharacterized protein LOC130987393 isoform X2 n=1 Tax=Salvia miltiorrhiza TaxID=226208 RepID=UPI0025AC72C7|nr:uncharacterized protein LOC130987393 isoform X2 [Salvia miltiorrhiza]